MHAILHIVTVVCCLFKTTQTSSEVLDITTLATSLASDTQNEARGLIVKGNMTTNASIGILYKDAKQNVSWADTGHLGDFNDTTGYLTLDMPDDRIFSTTSKVTYSVHEDFMYLGVKSLPFGQRVGVFSFEASKDDVHTRSAVVVTELHGTITMKSRTQTVGVGESVTISLDRGRYLYSLQWRHNYGDPVTRWYSETSITLSNIRAKDGGVYECYKYETGRHGIMRLIVRGCPSPKWNPPDCEEDCPVCYNGGVCDDKTGVCICPAGFTGEHCETACELHNWGRTCALGCTSGSNPTCMGVHFCPPDPVGCSCYRGYSGNDCHTACTYKQYGADCLQTCHCSSNDCDNGKGCRENVTCSDYYTGPGCQERKLDRSCPYGTFGLLCNYPCHCKSDAPCNRDGSCDAGCHEAWAGHDCSIGINVSSAPERIQCNDVLRYQVRYESIDGHVEGVINTTKLNLQVSIIGISKCVAYDVDARVVNSKDIAGDWGENLHIPPSAPSITENSTTNETTLLMKWKPASCDSYGNLHYFYQLLQNGNVQQEGSTTATHVILNEGIKACESYTFLVWSSYLNSNGTVVLEDVVAATYPNAPNITSLSTTASSITIRWSPPVDGSLCDVIEYNVIITSCLFTINKLTTNKYLHVEENINTGTEYNVKIAARNAKGYGEFSPNVMVATDVIKDGQINDLPAAAAAGNAETNIQKDEESNSNTSYIIAAILPSLFLLIIILLLLLVIRKLKKQNASQENSKHINNYLRMDAVNNPEEA